MIDVLLATYNGEPYLAEQLESLYSQEGVALHVFVRDDGSSDNSKKILQEFQQRYPDRLTVLEHRNRLGGKASFGWLLEQSRAPYVAFCDQDDVWVNHKLLTLFKRMQALESTLGKDTPLLVHSDLLVVDDKLKPIATSFWKYSGIVPVRTSLSQVLIKNPVTGCALLANRALVEKACPLPEEAVMHDHWLALVASAFGKIDFIAEPLVKYRQHGRNVVGAQGYTWSNIFGRLLRGCGNVDITPLRRQAGVFYSRFAERLGPQQASIIDGFARLSALSWWGRRKFLVHRGILLPGVVRNMALLFCARLSG